VQIFANARPPLAVNRAKTAKTAGKDSTTIAKKWLVILFDVKIAILLVGGSGESTLLTLEFPLFPRINIMNLKMCMNSKGSSTNRFYFFSTLFTFYFFPGTTLK
jgi:hypothetical protein